MTRLLLLLVVLLLAAPDPAAAQHHAHTDSAHAAPMGGMHHMMEMHDRMMADSLIHHHMMADSLMQAAMHEVMTPEMAALHARMAAMSAEERAEAMGEMHDRMMERMVAMTPDERHAMHERMMAAHLHLMAHPDVKARMMADPEMHEMMERMHEGGMHDGMDGMRKHDGGMHHHDEAGDTEG